MSDLSPQQVINLEIKLLQSPGKTLTTLHKYHLLQKNDLQSNIFKEFDRKNLSPKLKKMIIGKAYAVFQDPNANLKAFSIVIMKLIFAKQEKQQILLSLKSLLFDSEINVRKFKQVPKSSYFEDLSNLSKDGVKKIIIEFLNLLKYSSEENKIENLFKKYPLTLQLMTFFWRQVLFRLEVSEAYLFNQKIPTELCFTKLFDLLDIFYGKNQQLYFFQEENLFVQIGYEKQNKKFIDEIIIGEYFENQQQYQKVSRQKLQKSQGLTKNDLKFSSQTFKQTQPNKQTQQNINPFQLVLLDNKSTIKQKTEMRNSNCSIKSSNAFEKKNFVLASNRSDYSINLQDSQHDKPTPSFNQITEDQVKSLFQPKNHSEEAFKNKSSTKSTSQHVNMKQSATIVSFKQKLLKSSFLEEKYLKLKGSLQILPQNLQNLSNQNFKVHTRIKTDESQLSKQIFMSKQENLKKQESNEKRKVMKRSKSQRNSIVRESQVQNGDETNRVSLFDINCKKLKTSMQVQDFDFLSEKKKNNCQVHQQMNNHQLNQICGRSAYTCSCSVYKLQRNTLSSNIFTFTYKPQNIESKDFKKKNKKQEINRNQQQKLVKNKSKLDDNFFQKLRAIRQQLKTSNSKNKSDPKHKSKQQQRNFKKSPFTKYSQFIKTNERNRSTSKTPDKDNKIKTKTTFPLTLQKFNTNYAKTATKNNLNFMKQIPKVVSSLKNLQYKISSNKRQFSRYEEQKRLKRSDNLPSFELKFHKLHSTEINTHEDSNQNLDSQISMTCGLNTSIQQIVSSQKSSGKMDRKKSFKVFELKSNHQTRGNSHFTHPSK